MFLAGLPAFVKGCGRTLERGDGNWRPEHPGGFGSVEEAHEGCGSASAIPTEALRWARYLPTDAIWLSRLRLGADSIDTAFVSLLTDNTDAN